MTEPEEPRQEEPIEGEAEVLAAFSREFEYRTAERHEHGAQLYGPIKFLSVDTLEEAMQEVLDLANYMRYTYIRLCFIREWMVQVLPPDEPEAEMHISRGFIKAKDMTEPREANS